MYTSSDDIVLDTSYLAAQFNPDDTFNAAAEDLTSQMMEGRWDKLFLLDSVFGELMAVLMWRRSYDRAKQIGDVLRNAEEIRWVAMDEVMDDAWHEFLVQPKGSMSLVDCAITAVCRRHGLKHVASFDRAFDQVPGIERLPALPAVPAAPARRR